MYLARHINQKICDRCICRFCVNKEDCGSCEAICKKEQTINTTCLACEDKFDKELKEIPKYYFEKI